MKHIFTFLLTLLLPLISFGQEHTYMIWPGDQILVDLQSFNPTHNNISNISFDEGVELDISFPIQLQEQLGVDVPADSTVAYVTPTASGIYSFSYNYVDNQNTPFTFTGSFEVIADSDFEKPLPCFAPEDSEQFMPASFSYAKIAIGDVAGDELSDVVVATTNGFMVCVNVDGVFTETGAYLGGPTNDIALNDFNGDGFEDIFLAKRSDAQDPSQIRLSNQELDWITVGGTFPSARDVELDVYTMDSGYVDIFLSGTPNEATEIYKWNGTQYVLAQSLSYQGQLTLDDFDNDGDIDLLVTPFFLDDFSDLEPISGTGATSGTDTGGGDTDGMPDYVSQQDTGNLNPFLYINDGTGVFSESNFLNFQEPIHAADFDNDGRVDFVTISDGANVVWLNDGTAGYTMVQSLGDANTVDIVSADVNDDGYLDLITCNRAGTVSRTNNIWINHAGDGTFNDFPIPFGEYGSFSIAVGDISGDENVDIFTTSVNGPSKIYFSSNPDLDGDGICDDVDNCPENPNADQLDADNNNVGDACDEGDLYPGDTNNDGVANNYDILNIGLAYGETGTPRVNASIDWVGQPSADWVDVDTGIALNFPNGLNYKFADCDGNAIVEEADVQAIDQNYGSTQGKDEDDEDDLEGEPPFYVAITENAAGGIPFSYPIILGEEDNPIADVFGVAFTINVDLSLVVDGSLSIEFEESWLGAPNDLIYVWHEFETENKIEVGVSRKYLTQGGYGGMGEMKGVYELNIDGKNDVELETVISISDYRIIDDRDEPILADPQETIVTISGLGPVEENLKVDIFPNPTSDILNINGLIKNAKIEIVNLLGMKIFENTTTQDFMKVDLSNYEQGIYFVIIWEGNTAQIKKIQVE